MIGNIALNDRLVVNSESDHARIICRSFDRGRQVKRYFAVNLGMITVGSGRNGGSTDTEPARW